MPKSAYTPSQVKTLLVDANDVLKDMRDVFTKIGDDSLDKNWTVLSNSIASTLSLSKAYLNEFSDVAEDPESTLPNSLIAQISEDLGIPIDELSITLETSDEVSAKNVYSVVRVAKPTLH